MFDENRERFRNIYASKKDTIEWMINFGDETERVIGNKIKQTALTK